MQMDAIAADSGPFANHCCQPFLIEPPLYAQQFGSSSAAGGNVEQTHEVPAKQPSQPLNQLAASLCFVPLAQLMDMCVEQTHEVPADQRSNDRPMRYTDSRMDEQVG